MNQAVRNAEVGLRGHLKLMLERGEKIPTPRPLEAVERDEEVDEVERRLISAELSD